MTQQAAPKADIRKAIDSFIDVDEPPQTVLDRSTLERYATCPAQAAFVESGRINTGSLAAAAGEEVHLALGNALAEYCSQFDATGTYMSKGELRAAVEQGVLGCRPDVQPEAIRGLRATLWAWTEYVCKLHPNNIRAFDGGEKLHPARSGQLAWDLGGGVLITSELDLLHATVAPTQLREVDYKSGWKIHTAQHVADSFQFQFHAVLVLNNFETVEALEVCVWNSRINRLTPGVWFCRDDLEKYTARIRSAIGEWWKHRGKAPELTDVWPAVEKCAICPAATLCPAAGHAADVATNPVAFLDQLVAVEAKADGMRKQAAAYVDQYGDIVTESGVCFGRNKPRSEKKQPVSIYHKGTNHEVQESDGDAG